MSLRDVVDELGGFATRRQLLAFGATDRMLTAAVRAGLVTRARNGWYSTRDPADPAFRAVRVGGRLTGLSAFDAWGGWVWIRPRSVHVAVPPQAARLRPQPGVRVHYDPMCCAGTATAVCIHDALLRVLVDEPMDVAVPCADWAMSVGRIDVIDLERVIQTLPPRFWPVAQLVDHRSQSVLESVARVRLRCAGFRVDSQQRTGMLGSTDLVVEGAVALELDGREFHEHAFERDRRRDLVTTVEGRHVIRVSATMIRRDWPMVARAVRAALAARRVENSGLPLQIARASRRSPQTEPRAPEFSTAAAARR